MLHLTYIEEYASSFVSFGVTHDVGTCESKEHLLVFHEIGSLIYMLIMITLRQDSQQGSRTDNKCNIIISM